MIKIKTLFSFIIKAGLICTLLGILVVTAGYFYLKPGLPDVEVLRDVQLQTPLRIYSADGKLISEFGEKRRTPISYEETPQQFIQAILSAEDSRFYEHFGVDIKGLARATYELARTGSIQTGGSTITMQVAKNYFLTRERTFIRKFNEILLALQIEQELSKEAILELYMNKIYLGNRAYGIQAAANVYYGKDIADLSLAQMAMIAGLPKAPSAYNPLANPGRALERRNWILGRMRVHGHISQGDFEAAVASPITASYHRADVELYAPYIAEMVRGELMKTYGDSLYTDGYKVFTSIQSRDQQAANEAVVNGLISYDQRHGYRGPEQRIEGEFTLEELTKKVSAIPTFSILRPALIINVDGQQATALLRDGQEILLDWEALSWAQPYKTVNYRGPKPKTAADVLAVGDVVRVVKRDDGWLLTQIPEAQAALISLTPKNGAIRALVGGFSFTYNKFNRVTQGTRQPGSNFKPFVYTAALANGFTPATLINDAPVVFEDRNLEGSWRPENYSKKFYGPTRLREALYKSRNLVSIRILRTLGINTAIDYVQRFGFSEEQLPKNLSLALGTADLTPLDLVTGYAVFANGGYQVEPYLITRIEDHTGEVIFKAEPATVCEGCTYIAPDALVPEDVDPENLTHLPLAPRVVDEQTLYLIKNIMQDVIKRGTGRKAKQLGRDDLAGKTGTTNDQKDAWFSGFNHEVVASIWVGFDQPKSLGSNEFGSTAALPIWIDYMQEALQGIPEKPLIPPSGIVSMRIDPDTGLRAYPGQENAIFEVFREGEAPQEAASSQQGGQSGVTEELF